MTRINRKIFMVYSFYRYASEWIEKLRAEGKLRPRICLFKWTPITINQLEGFLTFVISMGLISVPAIEDCYETSWIFEVPFFSGVMPRDSFLLIFWMLHVSHSAVSPPKCIDKIKLFLEMMLTRFQAICAPQRCMAVDETMLHFRGKFAWEQYMPKKPVKWGDEGFLSG